MRFPFDIKHGKTFDAVGFGTNAVDYLIRVPNYPEFNSKVELSEYIQAPGGEVASTMAGLSRLGLLTAYAGRFGSDDSGRFGMHSLQDEGVNIEFAESIEGARTQIAFIVIDEASGERTVIWQRDALLAYHSDDAPLDAATAGSVLHMTPHDAGACTRMATAAKNAGTIISTDIDNVFDGMESLLPMVDILITSFTVPEKLTGLVEQERALESMHEKFGCPIIGMTLGESGSLLFCEGQFIRSQAYAVPGGCKDTTGAGDAFRVGLLYGLINELAIEESAKAANAVAALKCRAIGARTALPTEAELRSFLG